MLVAEKPTVASALLPGARFRVIGVTLNGPLAMLLVTRRFVRPMLSYRRVRILVWGKWTGPNARLVVLRCRIGTARPVPERGIVTVLPALWRIEIVPLVAPAPGGVNRTETAA